MVGDGPGVVPAQVPVAVVRHPDQRGRVGGGAHRRPQLVLPGQRVEAAGGDDAWVPFLAVARDVRQPQRRPLRGVHRLGRPDHLVPALHAAVRVVRAVVGRHREPTAVELERTVADPVRHPPDQCLAEVLLLRPDIRRGRRNRGRRWRACRRDRAPRDLQAWPRKWPPWPRRRCRWSASRGRRLCRQPFQTRSW